MDDKIGKTAIDVRELKHSEDLLKVEDIIVEEFKAIDVIGFRFTSCPMTQSSVTPRTYLYTDKYNPTKEELDQQEKEIRKKYATERALSMFTTDSKAEKQANRLVKKMDEDEAEAFMEENAYIVKFVIPSSAGVVNTPHKNTGHFNYLPGQDIDVLSLMDETYGYKKIDYGNGSDK